MPGIATLKARIAQEMKRSELTACSTAVQTAMLSAIEFFETRRFPWNEFEGSVKVTTSSASFVTLSSASHPEIVKLDSVRMDINNRSYPLIEKTWRELEEIDATQYYGYPDYYAVHSEKVRLYPPPNAAYSMMWSGVFRLPNLDTTSASSSNAWTERGEEMIRLKAKSILFRDELRNPQMAEYFEREAEKKARETNKETIGKQSSGRVRRPGW